MKKFTTLILAILILSFNKSLPKETAFTQEDKEILIRIETSLKVFMEQTNKRFQELREDMNKRFQELREDTNKRFEIVDKRITELREDMNKRFEQVDKRITELREDMNKRFEQVDKRFEQVNERFNDLINFLWIITGIFTTIMVATLGFAWWDRRTIIRKAREETVDYLKREGDLRKVIETLREKAKTDKELAEILKSYGLL